MESATRPRVSLLHVHIQSVQWMWAAVTVAGLSGAYMGYNRYAADRNL